MKPEAGLSHLRKGRHSKNGQIYHCIFSTLNRQPIFKQFDSARGFISLLREDENRGLSKTYAFVVMPDHIHWLFQLEQGDLSVTIKRIKSLYSKQSKSKVWNKGFYDHGIRAHEDLISTARYIVANPLRAGLVDKIGDYPHWDSIFFEG